MNGHYYSFEEFHGSGASLPTLIPEDFRFHPTFVQFSQILVVYAKYARNSYLILCCLMLQTLRLLPSAKMQYMGELVWLWVNLICRILLPAEIVHISPCSGNAFYCHYLYSIYIKIFNITFIMREKIKQVISSYIFIWIPCTQERVHTSWLLKRQSLCSWLINRAQAMFNKSLSLQNTKQKC